MKKDLKDAFVCKCEGEMKEYVGNKFEILTDDFTGKMDRWCNSHFSLQILFVEMFACFRGLNTLKWK